MKLSEFHCRPQAWVMYTAGRSEMFHVTVWLHRASNFSKWHHLALREDFRIHSSYNSLPLCSAFQSRISKCFSKVDRYLYPCFIDGETGAQSGDMTCSRSYSWSCSELGVESRSTMSPLSLCGYLLQCTQTHLVDPDSARCLKFNMYFDLAESGL